MIGLNSRKETFLRVLTAHMGWVARSGPVGAVNTLLGLLTTVEDFKLSRQSAHHVINLTRCGQWVYQRKLPTNLPDAAGRQRT